jgi:hypothetical protein
MLATENLGLAASAEMPALPYLKKTRHVDHREAQAAGHGFEPEGLLHTGFRAAGLQGRFLGGGLIFHDVYRELVCIIAKFLQSLRK